MTGAARLAVLLMAFLGYGGTSDCIPACSGAPPVMFGNGEMQATVTPSICGVRAGSLVQLLDLQTEIDLAGGLQFGGIQCGPFVTQDGMAVQVSDSEVIFSSPGMIDYSTGNVLPIENSIYYRLNGRGLEMTFTIHAAGEVEITYPLEVDFSTGAFDCAVFANQTCTDRLVDYDGTHGNLRISGDQIVRLQRTDEVLEGLFVFPNPSNAILATNDQPSSGHYLTLRFLDTEPPRETASGPLLHSTLPAGYSATVYVRLSLDPGFMPAFISFHPDFYETTGSWMLDDLPFRHPPDPLWTFSEDASGPEYCSALLIQLLEAHPAMVMNWLLLPDGILAPNCDSMRPEPGYEDSWSHWHSTWRICTEAPEDYLQWLRNIETDAYPWADRVSLGEHGYHHTPSPDSAWDPFHEFITYEPEEHMERFDVIREDLEAIGLDTTIHRALRFPGHRTSLSGIYALARYGYAFYCNGVRWYETMGGEPFYDQYISHYVTPDGSIWGSNTVWWGDYPAAYPYEYLSAVMSRGKHCLLGGHPSQMLAWGAPEAWARLDSVCTSLETDYPRFGWLFPEDYGEFLSETSAIVFSRMDNGPGQISAWFDGQTSCGQTMVADLSPLAGVEQVYVDGSPVAWEMHGTRLFASIDGLGPGPHVLLVDLIGVSVGRGDAGPPSPFSLEVASPFSGSLTVECGGLGALAPVRISVFDLSGRLVAGSTGSADGSGALRQSLEGTAQLPPGMYLVRVGSDGLAAGVSPAVKLP